MKKQTQNIALLAGVGALAYYLARGRNASAATPSNGGSVPDPGEPATPEPRQEPEPQPKLPDTPNANKRNAPTWQIDYEIAKSDVLSDVIKGAGEVNALAVEVQELGDDWMGPPPSLSPEEVQVVRGVLEMNYNMKPSYKIADWIADQAYWNATGTAGQIPNKKDRGSGWEKYIDLWQFARDQARDRLAPGLRSA